MVFRNLFICVVAKWRLSTKNFKINIIFSKLGQKSDEIRNKFLTLNFLLNKYNLHLKNLKNSELQKNLEKLYHLYQVYLIFFYI